MNALPFEAALGPAIDRLAPAVREHFAPSASNRRVRGVMRRVWRRPGLLTTIGLRLAAWSKTLFPETGADVPFEMENAIVRLADGRLGVTWNRTFHFPGRDRRFNALMTFSPERRVVVDWLGDDRALEVELRLAIEEGAMVLRSGRQWRWVGRVRVPLPRWLVGCATVRVWDAGDDALGVRVTVWNPILGDFFGYDGAFREVVERPSEVACHA